MLELIQDRKGNIIYKNSQKTCTGCNDLKNIPNIPYTNDNQIVDEDSNYQLISMLEGREKECDL